MPVPVTLSVPAVAPPAPVAVKTLAATPVTASLKVTVKVAGVALPLPPVTATVGAAVSLPPRLTVAVWLSWPVPPANQLVPASRMLAETPPTAVRAMVPEPVNVTGMAYVVPLPVTVPMLAVAVPVTVAKKSAAFTLVTASLKVTVKVTGEVVTVPPGAVKELTVGSTESTGGALFTVIAAEAVMPPPRNALLARSAMPVPEVLIPAWSEPLVPV